MRRLVYTGTVVAGVIFVAGLAALRSRFSLPAPLHRAHADLAADCFACHTEDRQVDGRKCSGCHRDPETGEPTKLTGFARHHLYRDLDCLRCHTEHQGLDGNLTRAEHAFQHVACQECHSRHVGKDYWFVSSPANHPAETLHRDHAAWKDDCFVCHEPGSPPSAEKCTKCHDPRTGEKVTFQGFAAHHTYKDLNCLSCHSEHRGRTASLLRPGKSVQMAGCKPCHERQVGPDHTYSVGAEGHPQRQLHPAHEGFAAQCSACHTGQTGQYKCAPCHAPGLGAREGFASHHGWQQLDCLTCHTEHKGKAEDAMTRPGSAFHQVNCATCHQQTLTQPTKLGDMSRTLRGEREEFVHSEHPPSSLSCAECHPMKDGEVHVLAGRYSRNCSECHHRSPARARCEDCHRESFNYTAGLLPDRLGGRIVKGKGSHAAAEGVHCTSCHRYDRAAKHFLPPEKTCAHCHEPGYTERFLARREQWHTWRRQLVGRSADDPKTKLLEFVGRNWYHNEPHAEAVRGKN